MNKGPRGFRGDTWGDREVSVEDAGREDVSEEIYNFGFRERV